MSLYRLVNLHTTTLDFYVFRRFVVLYAANLICFTLVYVAIDAFENLDEFMAMTETWSEFFSLSIRYYLAIVPVVFCQLLGPVIALTSGLFTITLLHRANELVPMLANGRPYWRVFMPILLGGVAASCFTFLLQELWIPTTADTIREVSGKRERTLILENQIFLDRPNGILVVMKEYDVQKHAGSRVTVIPVETSTDAGTGETQEYIQAHSMVWTQPALEPQGYWMLQRARVQEYDGKRLVPPPFEGPEGIAPPLYKSLPEYRLKTTITPETIESYEEDVTYMKLLDLRKQIDQSEDHRWIVKYQSRFAVPIGSLVLLLVGLPVIAYFGSRNIFLGALVSAVVATAYFVVSAFVADLALQGYILASLGPWFGPLFFAAMGVAFLKYLRT